MAADAFPLVWRVRARLPERKGQRCRVTARSTGPGPRSVRVEFEDGSWFITSGWYVRRAPLPPITPRQGVARR